MAKIFRKPSSVKLPQRNGESTHDQYGSKQKGIIECPRCYNVRHKERWYSSFRNLKPTLKLLPPHIAKRELCPACRMVSEHVFEGEVVVGEVPPGYRLEFLRLVRNFGERARAKDPQDRIIAIKKNPKGYHITTTENQLAIRIAKKIRDSFAAVRMKVSYSEEPYETGRVIVVFEHRA